MIILDDTKSLSVLASDTSNGLGQIGCINPTITENLNGSYELEFDIATSEKYFSLLHTGGLVKCLHNTSEQIFRIYFISKAINGIVNVKAQHITYDLTGVVVKPFTATGAVSSVNGMLTNVIGTTPFTMTTDITNTTSNFTLDIPRSFRECLGGYEGSLLDVFRGEYEWDNLTVKMLAHRGADNGVRIAYGKNLTDFTQEENIENVYTGVAGYAVVDEVTYTGNVYTKVSSNNPRVKIVDFSSDYESGDVPTVAELTTKAQTYATNNPIEVPNVNIKVSFVPLWQTEEYKNILPLERVSLGDTVHVFFEKLNVEATARVIKTVWNVNLERYDEIELGDAKANLNTVINESVDSAVNNALGDLDIYTGAIESEMFQMSKLIANGMGLHMTKDSIGRIFLHNAEDLSQSQYQYMITANGFMISNNYGQEGSWTSGWDADGNVVVNSLATITLKFLQGYGMYMRFGDINSNYIEVAPYSVNDVPQGVSFDGSGSVRFQPQNEFIVRNIGADDSLYNYFYMKHQSNQNRVLIENYWYNDPQYLANYVQLISNSVNNGFSFANKKLNSADTANLLIGMAYSTNQTMLSLSNKIADINADANIIQLTSTGSSTSNKMLFQNYEYGSSNYWGNEVELISDGSKDRLTLTNYRQQSNVPANRVRLTSDSSGNVLSLENYNANNTRTNSINMKATETNYIWSRNDARLLSSGAVRIGANSNEDGTYVSGGSQDVYIHGKTIKFFFEDKASFYVDGVEHSSSRKNLEFSSDGYVRWTSS